MHLATMLVGNTVQTVLVPPAMHKDQLLLPIVNCNGTRVSHSHVSSQSLWPQAQFNY